MTALFAPVIGLYSFGYLHWGLPPADLPHLRWFLTDDAYYYFQIARHLLDSGRSTFDGFTLTNGYHPLWMFAVAGTGAVTGGFGPAFFVAIQLVSIAACVTAGLLLAALLRRIGFSVALRSALFIYLFYLVCTLSFLGMEVTLTIPLLFAFVLALLPAEEGGAAPHPVLPGALGALLILSRIDSLLLVFPSLALVLLVRWRDPAARRAALAGLAVCAATLVLYAAANRQLFGAWLPVSGAAKQLKASWWPGSALLDSLLAPRSFSVVFQQILPLAFSALVALFFVPSLRRLSPRQLFLLWLAAYPAGYYTLLALLYDWPIDSWYRYPLLVSVVAAAALLHERFAARDAVRRLLPVLAPCAVAAVTGYAAVSCARILRLTPDESPQYYSSLDLAAFARAHPGRYAMGDRAGLAGFLTDAPILQVEGLVADRKFVGHLARQDDLLDVLREYGVTYYAVVAPPPVEDGCHHVAEPTRPGPQALRMRGRICAEPVLKRTYSNKTHLVVFRVPPAP